MLFALRLISKVGTVLKENWIVAIDQTRNLCYNIRWESGGVVYFTVWVYFHPKVLWILMICHGVLRKGRFQIALLCGLRSSA